MRKIFLPFLSLLPFMGLAQKQLKEVKLLLKKNNSNGAITKVKQLEKDSLLRNVPKLYDYAIRAYDLSNEQLNEKIYLHRSYDTVKYFDNIKNIYQYALVCDSVEQQCKKLKYRPTHQKQLHDLYNNLTIGARFFYKKNELKKAADYLRIAVDYPLSDLWGPSKSIEQSKVYKENLLLLCRSLYATKQYALLENYEQRVLEDSTLHSSQLFEMLAMSHFYRQQTVAYLNLLNLGLNKYPEDLFYYTHLADYYVSRQDYAKILSLSDKLLQLMPKSPLLLEGKTLALVQLEKYSQAVESGKELLEIDPKAVETYYYVGLSYYKLAMDIILPTSIRDKEYTTLKTLKTKYLKSAEPYLEKYSLLEPLKKDKWASMLSKIYLELNEGDKFETVDY